MKYSIAILCVFILLGVSLYFYQRYDKQVEAAKAEEQQKMTALCPETEPGRKWASMKTMNQACRAQGYID